MASSTADAGEMVNDPKGYHDLRWGTALAEVPGLRLVKTIDRTTEFDLMDGVPLLGEAKVESLRFITIDQLFARVVIRYGGRATHAHVLAHMEKIYGPLDRTPGSMMRGLNQQFNWRGPETEVNLMYESARDRGLIFIESRVLAPRFNEGLSDSAY